MNSDKMSASLSLVRLEKIICGLGCLKEGEYVNRGKLIVSGVDADSIQEMVNNGLAEEKIEKDKISYKMTNGGRDFYSLRRTTLVEMVYHRVRRLF